MSILSNPNFISFSGEPITGRIPTKTVVYGPEMTKGQHGGVAHVYKVFCDAVKVSPAKYHVQNRVLADGTKVRMISNWGVDTVMVWPVAGSESGETLDVFIAAIRPGYGRPFDDEGVGTLETAFEWNYVAWAVEIATRNGRFKSARWYAYPEIEKRFRLDGGVPRFGNFSTGVRKGEVLTLAVGSGRYGWWDNYNQVLNQSAAPADFFETEFTPTRMYAGGKTVFDFPDAQNSANASTAGTSNSADTQLIGFTAYVDDHGVRWYILVVKVTIYIGKIVSRRSIAYEVYASLEESNSWARIGVDGPRDVYGFGGQETVIWGGTAPWIFNRSGSKAVHVANRSNYTYAQMYPGVSGVVELLAPDGNYTNLRVMNVTSGSKGSRPTASFAWDHTFLKDGLTASQATGTMVDGGTYKGSHILAADFANGVDLTVLKVDASGSRSFVHQETGEGVDHSFNENTAVSKSLNLVLCRIDNATSERFDTVLRSAPTTSTVVYTSQDFIEEYTAYRDMGVGLPPQPYQAFRVYQRNKSTAHTSHSEGFDFDLIDLRHGLISYVHHAINYSSTVSALFAVSYPLGEHTPIGGSSTSVGTDSMVRYVYAKGKTNVAEEFTAPYSAIAGGIGRPSTLDSASRYVGVALLRSLNPEKQPAMHAITPVGELINLTQFLPAHMKAIGDLTVSNRGFSHLISKRV